MTSASAPTARQRTTPGQLHPENPDVVDATYERWRPTLRCLCDPRLATVLPVPDTDGDHPLPIGALWEITVAAKLVGLLADRLLTGHSDELTGPMREFLTSTLRAARHRTRVHRHHAAAAAAALQGRGIPVAVLNGLAYDAALYDSRGTRHLTDIDLLVPSHTTSAANQVLLGLGYTRLERPGICYRLRTADLLAPTISIDVTSQLGHTSDPDTIHNALHRTTTDPHEPGQPLPVLTAADALQHTFGRVAARPRWRGLSDALRLVLATPEQSACQYEELLAPARAGWHLLHKHWPDLPTTRPADGPAT